MLDRLGSIAFALAATMLAHGAVAQTPAVVELYTSQGCSSCPPADELLAELAERDDVIALSLHVDYWDYLGWRDIHARHEFTKRQAAYRDAQGARSVYTPQMVIQGTEQVVGSRRGEVSAALEAAHPPPTSGNRPIPVSGIANRVFSVATRNLAGWEMPTPPPIVIPSMKATTDLG